MSIKMQVNSGFTLLEILIAFSLIVILVLMIYPKIVGFVISSKDDFENMIVWEYALSEMNHIKANPGRIGTTEMFNIGWAQISVTSRIISGSLPPNPPPPSSNQTACANVEVMAWISGRENSRRAVLRGVVCRFP